MSFGITLTQNEKDHIIYTLESNLCIKLKENKFDKIYNTVCKFYGKQIMKEFKELNVTMKQLLSQTFVINIVLNYGLLMESIPGSLVDFKSFKRQKIKEHKKELTAKLNKYRL